MNYYRRYVGDYLRDTSRLSMLEHGAYNLLLDYYYAEETPIPANLDEVYRLVRAMLPAERTAVVRVLTLYFEKIEDGYRQPRADAEIAAALPHIEAARENGRKGGRPPKKNPAETSGETQLETQSETRGVTQHKPTGEPSTNHQPPSSNLHPPTAEKPTVGLKPDRAREESKARGEAKAIAERVIAYLNAKAGTRFQPSEANVKLLVARVLHDGATEADLKAVVDLKAAEAGKGEFDRKYLRPATLWNALKYAQYVGQLQAQAPEAGKRAEPMAVYAENEAGERHHVKDYPPGPAEDAARCAFAEYGSVPWMRRTRNLVVRVNGSETRFALSELALG